jgi:hypothetical protein
MSLDDLTSGDLLYRLDLLDFSLLFSLFPNKSVNTSSAAVKSLLSPTSASGNPHIVDSVDEIFNYDYRVSFIQSHSQQRLQRYLTIRTQLRKLYESKLQYFSRKLIKTIHYHKNHYLLSICQENSLLSSKLQSNSSFFSSSLFSSICSYYEVLRKELFLEKKKLKFERLDKEIHHKGVSLLKNILIFNCHLILETKKNIEITVLIRNSPQFLRCSKAVFDNLGNSNLFQTSSQKHTSTNHNKNLIYETLRNKEELKVINIFKLKNNFLSNNLQVTLTLFFFFFLIIALLSYLLFRKFLLKFQIQK